MTIHFDLDVLHERDRRWQQFWDWVDQQIGEGGAKRLFDKLSVVLDEGNVARAIRQLNYEEAVVMVCAARMGLLEGVTRQFIREERETAEGN